MKVKIGNVFIGDNEKVLIQSMTNTDTRDIKKTVKQIDELTEAGCDIVRCTVPDMESACAIKEIKKQIKIPLVADIHFDYRLAIESVKAGVDKVRINPGNIGGFDKVCEVVKALKERNIPLRIGVNAGSLDKKILEKYGKICPEALVESAKEHIDLVNRCDYDNIVVSLKCSNTRLTVDSYRLFNKKFDLLYNLREYFNDLPRLLESINGFIQINSSENTFLPNEFIIKFNEKLTFSEINKILDFKIEGYKYIQYEETD